MSNNGVPEALGLWKTPSGKSYKEQHEKIEFMRSRVASTLGFVRPELVVIEVCAPQRNVETLRALVRVEAVCAQEARARDIPVLLVRVMTVREIAMGNGKMGKDTVYRKLVEQYPHFDWKPQDKGGDDMSDALAMAIAAPELADRQ